MKSWSFAVLLVGSALAGEARADVPGPRALVLAGLAFGVAARRRRLRS